MWLKRVGWFIVILRETSQLLQLCSNLFIFVLGSSPHTHKRVHHWQLWSHKDVSTAKHRRCICRALMESLCALLMRTAWSKMITDAKQKLAYRAGLNLRCKSVTLICKNAYLMKVVTLNNGMYLFSVNRSAANCTDAFIILNNFRWLPTSRCAPVDSAHREFILETLSSTGERRGRRLLEMSANLQRRADVCVLPDNKNIPRMKATIFAKITPAICTTSRRPLLRCSVCLWSSAALWSVFTYSNSFSNCHICIQQLIRTQQQRTGASCWLDVC